MPKINLLKKKIREGDEVIGTWSSLSSSNVIDVLGRTKLDFVIIDMEHGSSSFEKAEDMVRAAESSSISPIIRVLNDDSQTILRALELNSQSILIPHIKTANQAESVASSCRYFPEGKRGLSPYTRVHNFSHENLDISLNEANSQQLVGILVEGQEGLTNLEEIAMVEGIDLIYLGLFDISQAVGLPGQLSHPKVLKEIERCQKVISSSGKCSGSMSIDLDYIKMLREKNFQFIAYLNDAAALKNFFDSSINQLNL